MKKFEFKKGDIVCRVGRYDMWMITGCCEGQYQSNGKWKDFQDYSVREYLPRSRVLGWASLEFVKVGKKRRSRVRR